MNKYAGAAQTGASERDARGPWWVYAHGPGHESTPARAARTPDDRHHRPAGSELSIAEQARSASLLCRRIPPTESSSLPSSVLLLLDQDSSSQAQPALTLICARSASPASRPSRQ